MQSCTKWPCYTVQRKFSALKMSEWWRLSKLINRSEMFVEVYIVVRNSVWLQITIGNVNIIISVEDIENLDMPTTSPNSEEVSWHRINVNVWRYHRETSASTWQRRRDDIVYVTEYRTLHNERAELSTKQATYTQTGTAVKTCNSNYLNYDQIGCKNINY